MGKRDNRRWPRQKTCEPVSFKCCEALGTESAWHVGEMLDVSVNGMKIVAESLGAIPLASSFEILYFPQEGNPLAGVGGPDPEPLWFKGRLVWQDREKGWIGLSIES